MGGESAEPKAEPLRVPVADVPVRHSILAPEPQPPLSAAGTPPRPSVVSQPVRYVSNHRGGEVEPSKGAVSPSLEPSDDMLLREIPAVPPAPAVPSIEAPPAAQPAPDGVPGEAAEPTLEPAPEPASEAVPVAGAEPVPEAAPVAAAEPPAPEAIPIAAPGPTPADVPVAAEEASPSEQADAPERLAPEPLASDTFDIEPMDILEGDAPEEEHVEEVAAPPTVESDADDAAAAEDHNPDTLDLDPAEVEEALESVAGASAGHASLPPPPPERVPAAQPPPPPPSAKEPDVEEIEVPADGRAEVVIDLMEEPPAGVVSAPPPPPVARESSRRSPPPPPPPTGGRMEGAAHRVADLRPSEPRKHPWWEVFFDDDYLRSVRVPSRQEVATKADFIEQRLGLVSGSTVLDVGCGWGVDVVELSARGYLGVGMDLSLAMLSRAADEAQDRGQRINFLHADMREMNFDGTFDAVMCLGTTFGYFDDDMNRLVIERLHRALKPQGVLLIETVNRDHVIRSQPNLVWFEGDGCVCMEESEFNYFTSRLHVKRTVILDDGKQRENEYSVRLYSLHELGQMLHHQGFRVTEVSGRLAVPGVFFGQESPQLLVVAERRAEATGRHSALDPSGEVPE